MSSNTYKIMLRFTPDALIDLFSQQYAYEQGQKKLHEVVHKIESSPKVVQFITHCVATGLKPDSKDINRLLNSITYFIFSKAETLCMGGLVVIILWKSHADPDEEIYNDDNKEVTQLCTDFIFTSDKMKIHVKDTLFDRFFRKIRQIGNDEI